MNKKVLISVAWPYVNGNIHVGHLAGYLIPADIMARFHRVRGNDVLMVSGSDCHGTPITIEADKTGKTPNEVVDLYHANDLALFRKYKLDYNLYTKTTTETHKEVTQDIFLTLLEKGLILKKVEKQYYSSADKKFLPDRYVEGECPHCGTKDQRGDQCENCGRMIEAGALINPKSKLTGAEVELKETEHYYFDLSKLQKPLEKYIASKQGEWREWIFAEASGWLKEGLKARAITRDIDWGIEIPKEKIPAEMLIDNIENKRFYVWFEAVIGYLSASQEFSKIVNSNDIPKDVIFNKFEGQSSDWKDWWYGDNVKQYNFMGQDNVVFHTIMWQAELIGYDEKIHLPDNVAANKFMNFKGKKFSKSRNWIVDSNEIADEFGIEAVRFFIASNLPENKEANFTWEGFIDTNNNELVANLGNFFNRTLTFANRFFKGKVAKSKVDSTLNEQIEKAFKDSDQLFENAEIVKGLNRIMELSSLGNKMFNDSKVWETVKTDEKKAEETIYSLLKIIEALSVLISPILPDASDKLRDMIGREKIVPSVDKNYWNVGNDEDFNISSEVKPIFAKIDREVVLKSKNDE